MKILLFGGTTEGRILAEKLQEQHADVTVCVATENGEEELAHLTGIQVKTGRLKEEEILSLLKDYAFCIDATHPYAVQISRTLKEGCENAGIPYRRIVREANHAKADQTETGKKENVMYFPDAGVAAAYLENTEGNILLTIGTRQLSSFCALDRERLFARILPMPESLEACRAAGLKNRQVIAMQGPFSQEMNEAIIGQYAIRYLVTKDGGREGGFFEKAQAAAACHIPLLVLERPREEGISMQQLLEEFFGNPENPGIPGKPDNPGNSGNPGKPDNPGNPGSKDIRFWPGPTGENAGTQNGTVYLVGCGCGKDGMTNAAREVLERADLLIGAGRLLAEMEGCRGRRQEAVRAEEILQHILQNRGQCIAVLFSGDTGFYSGAAKLLDLLKEEGIEASVLPGISSVQYFAARLGRPWQDWNLCSVHGKEIDLSGELKKGKPLFLLTGSGRDPAILCGELVRLGVGDTLVHVGEALSYPEEQIRGGTACEMAAQSFQKLNVMLIETPSKDSCPSAYALRQAAEEEPLPVRRPAGIPDDAFIRAQVPMTKQEIRAVILAKLSPRPQEVCWDIGAGTGSVSVELAMAAKEVWAVEYREEACSLILQNREKFAAGNLTLVRGRAPEILSSLPRPDVVFIGGSGGELAEILDFVLTVNPAARLCISAITLETVGTALAWMKEHGMDAEITQIAVSRGKKAGEYHLMSANNPVFLLERA